MEIKLITKESYLGIEKHTTLHDTGSHGHHATTYIMPIYIYIYIYTHTHTHIHIHTHTLEIKWKG